MYKRITQNIKSLETRSKGFKQEEDLQNPMNK